MTSRERLLAVVNGEPPDQTPVIVWPQADVHSDAAVVSIKRLANAASSPRLVLAEILNPLGRALRSGYDLNHVFHEEPEKGEQVLQGFRRDVQHAISIALAARVDGIFYRLIGAHPDICTPMEYGGHYLEMDRALLSTAAEARLNLVYIEGGRGTYLDFVSDLPAHAFGWDCEGTGVNAAYLRKLRSGILATADPDADILLGSNYGLLQPWIRKQEAATNV
jgi:hypothetical protein